MDEGAFLFVRYYGVGQRTDGVMQSRDNGKQNILMPLTVIVLWTFGLLPYCYNEVRLQTGTLD